jgi:hypothetical protein
VIGKERTTSDIAWGRAWACAPLNRETRLVRIQAGHTETNNQPFMSRRNTGLSLVMTVCVAHNYRRPYTYSGSLSRKEKRSVHPGVRAPSSLFIRPMEMRELDRWKRAPASVIDHHLVPTNSPLPAKTSKQIWVLGQKLLLKGEVLRSKFRREREISSLS